LTATLPRQSWQNFGKNESIWRRVIEKAKIQAHRKVEFLSELFIVPNFVILEKNKSRVLHTRMQGAWKAIKRSSQSPGCLRLYLYLYIYTKIV